LGGDGNGGNSFATIVVVASLHFLINAMKKEERENN
jgi:hypothetical protein